MKYTAVIQGQRLEIELNRNGQGVIEAKIDGRSYQLRAKPSSRGFTGSPGTINRCRLA